MEAGDVNPWERRRVIVASVLAIAVVAAGVTLVSALFRPAATAETSLDRLGDTPQVLSRYAERYGADPRRWLFLTGDKRAIYCLATGGFRLSVVDPAEPNPPPCGSAAWLPDLLRPGPAPAFASHGSAGLLMHSARLVLVDRAGRIRAYHLATDDDSLARLRPNVKTLLGERHAG